MAKASPTQAWLWHQRLSHLNFDYINLLSKKDVVIGLPKLKYVKDQLCSSCEVSKAKRSSFKSKTVPSSKGRLNLLHMDLCGPMRVASINGKRYILVIVDDYSRYSWTIFLRSKDETPEVLKDLLTMIQRNLQAPVISSKGYRVYNKRTRLIVESINLRFDEIKEVSETFVANDTLGLVPQRQKVSDYDNPDPALELQTVSPSADTTVPSQQDLDLLFSPLYDDIFNNGTSRVNKSSSPTDNSAPQDTHPSMNIHPTSEPTTPTNVNAEENNDNQAEFTIILYTGGYGCTTRRIRLIPDHPYKVYLSKKASHGLKQAPESLLRGTIHMGLWYPKGSGFELTAFSDADHAGCIDTRKSTFYLVNTMRTQLQDYGFNYNKIPLYCDSQSAIAISATPTEYQLADMFTKALPEERFQYLVRRIGMRCLTPAELEGYIKMSWWMPHSSWSRIITTCSCSIQDNYKHQDSRIMKAQELKTKTSAQTLIYKIFLQRYQVYQGRLLASFQDDAKYEHVGQDTRSQGGKDVQGQEEKILKISDHKVEVGKTMTKDQDKDNKA
ncbi:retrovirus-related pol polyprotein from transposon TNT 1-94 [Tanacetum coccineum]